MTCHWGPNSTGNPRTKPCERPYVHTTLSDHSYCEHHWAEHEFRMATGFGQRIVEQGDTYLAPHALSAIEVVRAYLDEVEAQIRAALEAEEGAP